MVFLRGYLGYCALLGTASLMGVYVCMKDGQCTVRRPSAQGKWFASYMYVVVIQTSVLELYQAASNYNQEIRVNSNQSMILSKWTIRLDISYK